MTAKQLVLAAEGIASRCKKEGRSLTGDELEEFDELLDRANDQLDVAESDLSREIEELRDGLNKSVGRKTKPVIKGFMRA